MSFRGVRAKDLRTEDGPHRLATDAVMSGAVSPQMIGLYTDDSLRDLRISSEGAE